mmetsp:Transcript_7034/g.9349  ORF Transcript_7034/g.9349 Transcript_7034/m.9349 type:complete len:116 (+) Transcript_7034:1767-2114(+)
MRSMVLSLSLCLPFWSLLLNFLVSCRLSLLSSSSGNPAWVDPERSAAARAAALNDVNFILDCKGSSGEYMCWSVQVQVQAEQKIGMRCQSNQCRHTNKKDFFVLGWVVLHQSSAA